MFVTTGGKTFSRHNAIIYECDKMPEPTVEELAGYISGNARRRQVADVLDKNGSETPEALEKLTRMPKPVLERTLKDMAERGVITKQNDKYQLTSIGMSAVTVLHSIR
jgi:predicted transcriptional regulator